MSHARLLLSMPVLCAALLAACASRSSGEAAFAGESSPGIATNAIGAAPAAREAANESKPLSELNTPEAIAARMAANPRAPATAAVAPAGGSGTPPVAAVARVDAHQKVAGVEKGAKVRVRAEAALRERPNETSPSVPAGAGEVELGAQIYNAGGYWYYVTAGAASGWLVQSDILR